MSGQQGRYAPIDPVALSSDYPAPSATGLDVESCVVGTNADLMVNVAALWIETGDRIIDMTYGNGAFWSRLPQCDVIGLDAKTGHDSRCTKFNDASFDVAVIDPPYRPLHGGRATAAMDAAYELTSSGLDTINDILALYRDLLIEAARIVRPGGRVIVKMQDIAYSHRLHLVHLDVLREMVAAGWDMVDLFVLCNPNPPPRSSRHIRQARARRSHSMLIVGVLPD